MRDFEIGTLLLICIPLVAAAAEGPNLLLEGGIDSVVALADDIYIEISDQVDDGCLPQPSRLKDKMEVSLRKSGFKISQESGILKDVVTITALGYESSSGSCAVHIGAALNTWRSVVVPYASTVSSGQSTLANIKYDIGSYLLTGSKSSMQQRLEETAEEFGDEFYLKISRAKDSLRQKFPEILKEYEQQNSPAAQ